MIINISVGPKRQNHPFYGKGSKYGYYINDVPGADLNLTIGQTYTFNINSQGHPFYFTTSESGGSDDNDSLNLFPQTDIGQVTFTVPQGLPSKFYYQCHIHTYMGGVVNITSHNTFYTNLIINELVSPIAVVADSHNLNNIYIADQIGIVYKYDVQAGKIEIFLDVRQYIPALNDNYDERGILGLCLHPQFSTNGRVFIFYSSTRDLKTGYYNCVSEFIYQNGRIIYEAEKVILRITRERNYHNGGKIGFGQDGYLYITTGDHGEQGAKNVTAQDLRSIHGKVLRINVNTNNSKYYDIPNDNPFINVNSALKEIWAYGFRNPWGLDFYNKDILIVTDAGYQAPTGREEVNAVIKGGNYGWNIKEGNNIAPWTNINNYNSQFLSSLIDPIFSYPTSDPNFSDSDSSSVIIGGFIDKNGDYICADYSGRLIRLRFQGNNQMTVVETASLGKWILSFGKVGDRLYVLTSGKHGPSGNTGEVHTLDII